MILRVLRLLFGAGFAWLAIRTAWSDWMLPRATDGTLVMSLLFFVLLPIGSIMAIFTGRSILQITRGNRLGALQIGTVTIELVGVVTVFLHVAWHIL